MNPEPPLLIIGSIPENFDLAHMDWPDAARKRLFVNRAKFKELDLVEAIVDGMPFLLTRVTAAETRHRLEAERFDKPFSAIPSEKHAAIGVAPGDIVTSARHLPEINQRILLLGKWIGDCIESSAAAWIPSRKLVSFSHFSEAVQQYLSDGRFPTLFQISCTEIRKGYFVTRGLDYFADQEIRLTAPPDYTSDDTAKRLIRVINDIAAHGKIIDPARTSGMIEGETLVYSPTADLQHLDILIENHVMVTGQTEKRPGIRRL